MTRFSKHARFTKSFERAAELNKLLYPRLWIVHRVVSHGVPLRVSDAAARLVRRRVLPVSVTLFADVVARVAVYFAATFAFAPQPCGSMRRTAAPAFPGGSTIFGSSAAVL